MTVCEKTSLDNGLRILTTAMPHTPSVSVGFYLGVGSRYETDDEAGAAHFIEHMIFKGTERRPSPGGIATDIEGRGGVFNGNTGQETTHYWARVARPHLDVALDVLTDMLRHSRFIPQEIERERRIIVDELDMTMDQPDSLVTLLINQTRWPDHPLGRDVAGSKASVSDLSRDELLAFQRQTYSPWNTVVSVAGDVDHKRVVEQLSKLLGDWDGPPPRRFVPAPADADRPRLALCYREIEQVHLVLGVPGLARDHPDRFVLSLLNTIMGEGMSSRLFLELRERRGLAYAVDSSIAFLNDTGIVEAYAALEPAHCEETIRALLSEWQRVREELVPESELRKAKEFTKGRLLLGLEGSMAVAGWWGQQELLGTPVLSADEVMAELEAVTVADVQRVARQCFVGQRLSMAVVGPLRDEALLHDLLEEAQEALPAA